MLSRSQIKEFQKRIKRGEPSGEVHEEMLRDGYSVEDIAEVFAPKPYDMRSWLMFSVVVVAILGVGAFINNGSFLILILAAFLLFGYFKEEKRLNNLKKRHGGSE